MARETKSLKDYLDPAQCPSAQPTFELFSSSTRTLHDAIDDSARRHGIPYLHPDNPSLQLDMLGSRRMVAWQEGKAECVFAAEKCWSELPQFYARYGVESARELIRRISTLENATGAILTDCGMQAVALSFDILAETGGHAILLRNVYNKTRRYLEWIGNRLDIEVSIVDDGDYEATAAAVRANTFLIFAETYTNPLMRALDPERIGLLAEDARKKGARKLRLIVDNTIATPWGTRTPLLDFPGIDIVLASGTKALAGQDRDLWGYIASRHVDFLNELMDLQAARGGSLDWRRATAIVEGFDAARENFEKRCRGAADVASFLRAHPSVEAVYHPSLAGHPDRDVIERHYKLPGSLLSFKIAGADEDTARHFADVLATTRLPRYAGSFDGLTTKINHHRTVSEYFTAVEELERSNIDRVLRLGVGLEAPEDIKACLNWALWHFEKVTTDDVEAWQEARVKELKLEDRTGQF